MYILLHCSHMFLILLDTSLVSGTRAWNLTAASWIPKHHQGGRRDGWMNGENVESYQGSCCVIESKREVYVTYVRSAKVYGSETWVMNGEQIGQLEWIEMRML